MHFRETILLLRAVAESTSECSGVSTVIATMFDVGGVVCGGGKCLEEAKGVCAGTHHHSFPNHLCGTENYGKHRVSR